MHEIVDAAGSRYNPGGEAMLVTKHVQRLIGAGLKASADVRHYTLQWAGGVVARPS